MNHNVTVCVLAVLVSGISNGAWAGSTTVPNTFTAGTPAKAAEINGNFKSLEAAINDNDTRITNLNGRATALENDMSAAQSELNQKLDLNGGAMTGDLTVPKVLYTIARTHTVAISGDMFRPRVSTEDYSSGLGNGGTRITTANSAGTLIAQAHLPDGAVVTGITYHFFDNDATNNLSAHTAVQYFAGGYANVDAFDTYSSSGASTLTQPVASTPTANTQVSNSSRSFVVFVRPVTGSVWTSNLLIRGVTFTYTISEAH